VVRELVGHQIVARDVERRALVEEHVLVHRRGGRVLHAAEDEVLHDDLRVAAPRERRPREPPEQLDHPRRLAEGAPSILTPPRRDVVGHRDARLPVAQRRAILDHVELPHDERHEVARQRVLHHELVDPGLLAAARLLRDELAVRQRGEAGGSAYGDLRRHLGVRLVLAREPVPRVLVLALAPDLQRPILHDVVRREEVEAALGLRPVRDLDAAGLRPEGDAHDELVPVVCEIGGPEPLSGVQTDAGEVESDGVERELARRGRSSREVEARAR